MHIFEGCVYPNDTVAQSEEFFFPSQDKERAGSARHRHREAWTRGPCSAVLTVPFPPDHNVAAAS